MLALWEESYDKPRQHIKKQRHHFANKDPDSQSYSFSTSHIRIWELDHKEGWLLRNWCFQIVGLEKTLERPWDCKEIKPVNLKGNQPWILIGRADAEVEAPILRPCDMHAKSLQSCPTFCDSMDCSPPGSSVHGLVQARILEWAAISFSRGSSRPRNQTCLSYGSCICRRVLYHWCHKELTCWKRHWCWERLKAKEEGSRW